MIKPKLGIFLFVLLYGGGDSTLQMYRFSDEKHAREWLKQDHVTDKNYAVRLCTYKERDCCGAEYQIRVHKRYKVSEFLATKNLCGQFDYLTK